jgi:hypothetical protein
VWQSIEKENKQKGIFYTMTKSNITSFETFLFSEAEPVLEFADMLSKSKYKSRTLRRKIKNLGVITSYNANSKFYTLPKFAKFDSYGLWKYKEIYFSQYGSFKKTLINLLNESAKGYSAKELTEITQVKTDDLLRILSNENKIYKQKIFNCFIYFAVKPDIKKVQINKKHQEANNKRCQKVRLFKRDEILILCEIISNTNLTFNNKTITINLNKKGYAFSIMDIESVMNKYALKKTLL